jgi:murein DD-endopeptidase MepM/ murein hydrolase activator NlpD
MLRVRSGRSAARLARLVRDQEVGGSTPLAPTIYSCLVAARPSYRSLALILAAAGIAFLLALNACAPAPRYLAHPEALPAENRGRASRGAGEAGGLGIALVPPVRSFNLGRITSPFSIRSSDSRRHDGVDIKASPGEEILAVARGVVAFSGSKRGYGNVVIIDHGNGISTLYAHLFYACVRKGESIGAGEILGRAGKRGNATGTHLHFEVRRDGSPIDPAPYL